MNAQVFARSVQGANHLRKNVVCQDASYWSKKADDAVIMAIADGHGSEKCKYSDEGAYRAVHVFCDIMQEVLNDFDGNIDSLIQNGIVSDYATAKTKKQVQSFQICILKFPDKSSPAGKFLL